MTGAPGRPMTGRAVLITGGSGGIGKATALRLAQMGASVSIIGRDAGRTVTAAREITGRSGHPVNAFTADLSAQAEVRRVAEEVLAMVPRPGGWSPWPPTPRRSEPSTSTTCKARAGTPEPARTTSPSSPTSCSPTSWHGVPPAPASLRTLFIRGSSVPVSAPQILRRVNAC
jgi:NAD(P)-dependent dehydrogenase (short-subunit alcohol dehydrogenase family)